MPGIPGEEVAAAEGTSPATPPDMFRDAMPKEEIGALALLQKHPGYDGRGVVIAVFDTGVDPSAAGLAVTTEGKPKVIDVVDGTGSGDIAMSGEVEAAPDGTLEGHYGKRLEVNPAWSNPSGKWRVGSKPLYELYSAGAKKSVMAKRKERWLLAHRQAIGVAVADLAALGLDGAAGAESAAAAPVRADAATGGTAAGVGGEDRVARRAELEARVKLLEGHAESVTDPGPMLHAVVWHDGAVWRAALDTSELHEGDGEAAAGHLAAFAPMTDFRLERQHTVFSPLDACTFAINIYDDGATLSVVTDCGAHGTHVAGIAAAHDAEAPGLNGVAPGAQIVSVKIGDSRLRGMETGPGLVRGVGAALRAGARIINMSYGEPTATPDAGRFVELLHELVHDEGVVFVASAGNSGPGLTTVGAPGGTSSALLSVGAYVSPGLAAAGHAQRASALPEGWTGQQYNWSSRGPTADGALGVTICAPGGAIAPVPQWSGHRRQLMNGTSMASPNAAGGIALLISAALQLSLPATPARVRRALENTALRVHASPEDALAYGAGLMQVHAALDYLGRDAAVQRHDVRYDVAVKRDGTGPSQRGIYLRDGGGGGALGCASFTVTLTPRMHKDADTLEKGQIEERLQLRCSQPWVHAPELLLLHHNGRQFDVTVDAGSLLPGLHFAEVAAVDAVSGWRGALARVPVTVCVPEPLPGSTSASENGGLPPDGHSIKLGPWDFEPGSERRAFLCVPPGATWAEMAVHSGPHGGSKLMMVHTTQLLPHTRPQQHRQSLSLAGGSVAASAFGVAGGALLEIAVAQFWKSEGRSRAVVEVSFHALRVTPARVTLQGCDLLAEAMVHAPLRDTKLVVSAAVDKLHIPLRPATAQLSTLGTARDALPGGRVMHRLLLTYKLKLAEGGAVTAALPAMHAAVYDGELEGQIFAMYDANKKRVYMGDVYPSAVTLLKGDYEIRLSLRHDALATLQALTDLPLRIEKALEKEVALPVHTSRAAALRRAPPTKEFVLRAGERRKLFVGPLPDEGWPKDAKPGCSFAGTLKHARTSPLAGDRAAPCATPLLVTVPPPKARKDGGDDGAAEGNGGEGAKAAEPPQSPAEALEATRRDADVKILKGLKVKGEDEAAAYAALRAELLEKWPKHLPLHLEGLERAAAKLEEVGKGGSAQEGVQKAADAVLAAVDKILAPEAGLVDEVEAAQCIAWKNAAETPEQKREKKTMAERKDALIAALRHRAKAYVFLLHRMPSDSEAPAPEARGTEAGQAFEAAYEALRKWVDIASAEYVEIYAMHERLHSRQGNAVMALDKVLGDKAEKAPPKSLLKLKGELLADLGWVHWAGLHNAATKQAFPEDFALI